MIGDELDIEIIRNGGRIQRTLSIELKWSVAGARIHSRLAGAVLMDAHYEDAPVGVFVSSIEQGSSAWEKGLRVRDLLLAVNGQSARHIGELARLLSNSNGAVLRVQREGRIGGLRL